MNSPGPANPPFQPDPISRRAFGGRLLFFFALCGGCAFWDLYSKHRVFSEWGYPNHQSPAYLDSWVSFRFYTSFNRGALWGIGQHLTWLFAGLSLIAVGVILYWLFAHAAAKSWFLTACLSLILAGTLGNLYDRLGMHGYLDSSTKEPIYAVRDFLLFQFGSYSWPVFNLADVFLVAGASCLVVYSCFGDLDQKPSPDVDDDASSDTVIEN